MRSNLSFAALAAIIMEATMNHAIRSLAIVFLCLPVAISAQDLVTIASQNGCCVEFNVTNANAQHTPINDMHFRIVTAGVTVGTGANAPVAPQYWTVTSAKPQEVEFAAVPGTPGMIRAGQQRSGFIICFDGNVPLFTIEWITTYNGAAVSAGFLDIRCLTTCDNVRAREVSDCCYDFQIQNRNSQGRSTSDFHLKVITPGVQFRPTPTAPVNWSVTSFTSTEVDFKTNQPVAPGGDLSGFLACLDFPGGPVNPFHIVWQTTDGSVVCEDTLTLKCSPTLPRCDSLSMDQAQDCCFYFKLHNLHYPDGDINDLHFRVLTPGVTIDPASTAPSPWSVSSSSATNISFSGPAIASGSDLGWFNLCYKNIPAGGAFIVEWCSTLDGKVICCDRLRLQCEPDMSCDSLLIEPLGECDFRFELLNRHLPASDLNDWHLKVLTPGVKIKSKAGASQWTLISSSPTDISYAGKAIVPGGSGVAFEHGFENIPATGVFDVEWCSTLDDSIICCEIVTLQCEPQQQCDIVTPVSIGNCCYNFTLKNEHMPSGLLNDFHLSIVTQGVTFRPGTITGPAQWPLATTPTSTTADFRANVGYDLKYGGVLSGFEACFDNIPRDGIFEIQWCSTLDGDTVCCDILRLQCDTTSQCDVVVPTPLGDCCFDFTLKNEHTPTGMLNDFHLSVLTPGVKISAGSASGPWTLTVDMPTNLYFKDASGGGISYGTALGGFKACFENIPASGLFKLMWCLTYNGDTVCCDILELQCEPTTGIEQIPGPRPSSFILHQNYPNPFNPSTVIEFEVPRSADVGLEIFNQSGARVSVLVRTVLDPGRYAVRFDASSLPSGIYYYKLTSGKFSRTRTMILLK